MNDIIINPDVSEDISGREGEESCWLSEAFLDGTEQYEGSTPSVANVTLYNKMDRINMTIGGCGSHSFPIYG
jgi:hypothetical protein